MTDRLAKIKKREAKATLGPWVPEHLTGCPDDNWAGAYIIGGTEYIAGMWDYDDGGICSTQDDAEFIAHARQDIPYLLRRLEAAEELIGECNGREIVSHKDAHVAWLKAKEA